MTPTSERLDTAFRNGSDETVKALLSNATDASVESGDGEIITLLKQAGAKQ